MPPKIIVGCCGYSYYRPPKGWKKKYEHKIQAYADQYPSVEINSTFYKLPRISTAKKWKKLVKKVNKSFIFAMKANQRITHAPSSPTYKKAKLNVSKAKEDKFGFFKPTEEVFKAWQETKKIYKALDAKICLFQCPPSFEPTKENLENLENFFCKIEGIDIVFEPRGKKWTNNIIQKICEKQRVIHAVDPFKREPAFITDILYFRLHGLGKRKYKYKFSNEDLKRLLQICKNQEGEEILVMFNNYESHPDAERFLTLLQNSELRKVCWKAEAIVDTIEVDFPTTKERILTKCGRWWCWVEPDKSARVERALNLVEKQKFESRKELLKSVSKIYENI